MYLKLWNEGVRYLVARSRGKHQIGLPAVGYIVTRSPPAAIEAYDSRQG